MRCQMMIRGCNRSQVCGKHLNVVYFLFSRQQRFKCLITVIPKPSWGVWFIPRRQISHTDFSRTLQHDPCYWKSGPLLGFIKFTFAPLQDLSFVCGCFFRQNYSEQTSKTAGILVRGVLSQKNKKCNIQKHFLEKSESLHSILDKYLSVYAPAVSSCLFPHILDVLPHS